MSTQTFDAYVPSNISEFFKQAKFEPNYVPFDTLHKAFLELDAKYKKTHLYSQKVTAPGLFEHSIRSCYFALALLYNKFPSDSPDITQITSEELFKRVYLTCMLHDVGLTNDEEALAHPAHAMSFELYGGIMAYDHLNTEYQSSLDAVQIGDVVQGIMLHTITFDKGKSSAAAMLLQLSALLDILGFDGAGPGSLSSLWNRQTVKEIEEYYPRGDMSGEAQQIIGERELIGKPNCITSHSHLNLKGAFTFKGIVQ